MHVQIACMLCSIDPGTANMLLPIAQATIISTPILLRNQIRLGIRFVRDRRSGVTGDSTDCDGSDDSAEAVSEETPNR